MPRRRAFNLANLLSAGFDWSGRSGRVLFLASVIPFGLLFFALTAFAHVNPLHPYYMTGMLLMGLVLVPTLGQIRRRLRDAGLSGWLMWLLLIPFLWLIFLIVLALVPPRHRDETHAPKNQRWSIALSCVMALFIASQYLWAPLFVAGDTMRPTLLPVEVLAGVPLSGQPERGQLVAYQRMELEPLLHGRVMAVAGDTIALRGGQVILNGTPLVTEALGEVSVPFVQNRLTELFPACSNTPELGEPCQRTLLRETLPSGASHEILDTDETHLDDMEPVTLAPGQVFVMGDNRDNVLDSRVPMEMFGTGILESTQIKGALRRVLLSLTPSRIGMALQ